MAGKLIITLCDDGTIRTNATGMKGSEKAILAELEALAAQVGGALVVERHEPGMHHHHHGDGHDHVHA